MAAGGAIAGRSAFSHDGRFVAVSGAGSRIGVFHTKLALMVNEFRGHHHRVSDVVSWPGRDTLVSSDLSGDLLCWRPQAGAIVARARVAGPVVHLSPQPGGSQVAVLTQGQGAWLLDLETGTKKSLSAQFPGKTLTAIAFNATGTQLAMGFKAGNVVVWNLTTQQQPQLGVFKTPICDLSFRGDTLLVANGTARVCYWLPTATVATYRLVSRPAWSVVSAGSQGVLAGLASGEIVRVSSATEPEKVVCIAKSTVMNVTVHPIESLVLATYAHAAAKTWRLK